MLRKVVQEVRLPSFLILMVVVAGSAAASAGGNSVDAPERAVSPTIDVETPTPAVTGDGFADSIPLSFFAKSGRLLFYVEADGVEVDEQDRPIPNGKGVTVTQSCEADAVVTIDEGRISRVDRVGIARAVYTGKEVLGARVSANLQQVYRDENGNLRAGCDPDSWTILSID